MRLTTEERQRVMNKERTGWIIPEIYDGISIWVEADGTLTNRWEPNPEDRRYRETERLIGYMERAIRFRDEARSA